MIHLFKILLLATFLSFFGNLFSQENTLTEKVNSLNQKAFDLRYQDIKKALRYNQRTLSLTKSGDVDAMTLSNVYSVTGTLKMMLSNYEESIDYHIKSLKIRESLNDQTRISTSHLNLANAYYKAEKFDRAILHYRLSIRSLSSEKIRTVDPEEFIPIYTGIGTLYQSREKLDSARINYNKALKYLEKMPDSTYSSVADLFSDIGHLNEIEGKYTDAIFFYNKAEKIQLELNDKSGQSWILHHLGIIAEELNQTELAKKNYNQAFSIAKSQNDLESLRDISHSKLYIFIEEKNSDSIRFYSDVNQKYHELFSEEINKKSVLEIESKYTYEKQLQQIKNAKERETFYILGAIFISLAFVLILFFLIRNYRQKQRIALLQVDVKNNEINELLNQQETASYAAMLEGQDQERLRIARELHDRLGSTLATIKLGLQNEDLPQAQQQVTLVNTAISEVRTIAHDLSGGNIEQYGLAAALNELKNTLDRSGKITLNLFMEAINIQASLHVTIYRIVQELVSNTLKHAEATEITLQLSTVDEQLNLIYEDNGKGFDLTHYQPGMGITNIRHRIEKWNGSLELDAQPNRGTIVILTVPITMQHD